MSGAVIERLLREWLAEEQRQEADARAAAESYRGVDIEACVDLSRSAARHGAIASRIWHVLHEAEVAALPSGEKQPHKEER